MFEVATFPFIQIIVNICDKPIDCWCDKLYCNVSELLTSVSHEVWALNCSCFSLAYIFVITVRSIACS